MPNTDNHIKASNESLLSRDQLFLQEVEKIMEKHLADNCFGVEHFAELVGLSRAQLNRRLRTLTGYSSAKFIQHYRIKSAAALLQSKDVSLKELATMHGFTYRARFGRGFKSVLSCTPTVYKKIISQQPALEICWKVPLNDNDFKHLLLLAKQYGWLTKLLLSVIDNMGQEPLKMNELAVVLNTSSAVLNRKIKKLFSTSALHFIRDIRLQYAIELLATKGYTISYIAYQAGFFDQAHFCRCFKASFGCIPTAFISYTNALFSINWLKDELMRHNDT